MAKTYWVVAALMPWQAMVVNGVRLLDDVYDSHGALFAFEDRAKAVVFRDEYSPTASIWSIQEDANK